MFDGLKRWWNDMGTYMIPPRERIEEAGFKVLKAHEFKEGGQYLFQLRVERSLSEAERMAVFKRLQEFMERIQKKFNIKE